MRRSRQEVENSERATGGDARFGERPASPPALRAAILGARYLFAPAHVGACEVHYRLPEGWQVHHPSGARRLGPEAAWEYPSYEILLDAPVVFGRFDTLRRDVSGTPFYFVFLDRAVGFESESGRFTDAVARVVDAFHGIFGAFPFDDYTFVLSLNPNNDWGLEHLASTMTGRSAGLSPLRMRPV